MIHWTILIVLMLMMLALVIGGAIEHYRRHK